MCPLGKEDIAAYVDKRQRTAPTSRVPYADLTNQEKMEKISEALTRPSKPAKKDCSSKEATVDGSAQIP